MCPSPQAPTTRPARASQALGQSKMPHSSSLTPPRLPGFELAASSPCSRAAAARLLSRSAFATSASSLVLGGRCPSAGYDTYCLDMTSHSTCASAGAAPGWERGARGRPAGEGVGPARRFVVHKHGGRRNGGYDDQDELEVLQHHRAEERPPAALPHRPAPTDRRAARCAGERPAAQEPHALTTRSGV